MLEQLHFFLGVVWVKVPRQRPHCSVELKRIVAERGRRSRGGHLSSSVLCVMRLPSSHKKSIPSLLMVPSFLPRLEQTSTIGLVRRTFGCRLCCCAWSQLLLLFIVLCIALYFIRPVRLHCNCGMNVCVGAGYYYMRAFERLVRGTWIPTSNEILQPTL